MIIQEYGQGTKCGDHGTVFKSRGLLIMFFFCGGWKLRHKRINRPVSLWGMKTRTSENKPAGKFAEGKGPMEGHDFVGCI